MKKQADLLNTLNALRANLGKKALPEWKAPEADLKIAISQAKQTIKARAAKEAQDKANAETDQPELKVALKSLRNSQKADIIAMAKDVKAKAKTKKAKELADMVIAKASKKSDDQAEGASDRFLGVAPKIARAKLRKAFGSAWKTKTAAEIAAVLKPTK